MGLRATGEREILRGPGWGRLEARRNRSGKVIKVNVNAAFDILPLGTGAAGQGRAFTSVRAGPSGADLSMARRLAPR